MKKLETRALVPLLLGNKNPSPPRPTLVKVVGGQASCLFAFPAVWDSGKQDASFHVAPLPTPLRCFLCPLQSAWSATWVMTTPGTLLPRCHWISCWHQAHILQILFSAHILTLSSLQNRKSRWEKIDQGPGKPQKKEKKKMSLNVSYATISIPLTHFFWRRHSSAHRSGYSCLETIAGVLLRQLLSYCKADAFFSRQSI